MIWLLRDFDLLSVLLRALTLGLEMLTFGGVAYLLLAAIPGAAERGRPERLLARASLGGDRAGVDGNRLRRCGQRHFDGQFSFASGRTRLRAILSGGRCGGHGRRRDRRHVRALPGAGRAICLCHARCSSCWRWFRPATLPRGWRTGLILAAFDAAHQIGASIWIGAMPFLLISLKRVADADEAKRLLRRFSPMALAGAGTLLVGGVGMAWFYLGISA